MDDNQTDWKGLMAADSRRKILFILRNMGSATVGQIRNEFRERKKFLSYHTIGYHMRILLKYGLLLKRGYPPQKEGSYQKNPKDTNKRIWVKHRASTYKTYELTSDAKIWLNQLESKSQGVNG